MPDYRFEVPISDLRKKEYVLRYWADEKKVRLVVYKELMRESTRKRKYEVIRWYDWNNTRDRHDPRFIPVEQVELPSAVKQAFIRELIENLTFVTTEGKR